MWKKIAKEERKKKNIYAYTSRILVYISKHN